MTIFASDLLAEVQQRLGDSNAQIWTADELNRYITDGYDVMTHLTGCMFGVVTAPDYAFAFNFTAEFEAEFAQSVSGWYCDGPANFTSISERDYLNNAHGPANHNEHWEFNLGHVNAGGLPTEVSPLFDLPGDLHEIERATWNTRRTTPLVSRDMEGFDSRYELNKGIVEGYMRDKDGVNTLRKWRVPNSAYIPYLFDDGVTG
jgi:hypothetical protein